MDPILENAGESLFRELAESNASASALDEHQQLEAAHRNQLVSQHFDQVMEDDDFLELGSPQPLFQAGTSQVAQGGASVKEEEEEEEDVNVKEEDLEEDCGDEEEKAATLTKWATFKTKKYRWSKRSGNAAMKHVKRVKGELVRMDRDHKVDGTFGSNMFRPSHTRRPMDNWSGLKDCQILELMANGLGQFFAKKAWRSNAVVRGFLVEAFASASMTGRPELNYRNETRVLTRIRALRTVNPECFKDPVTKHWIFESDELKELELASVQMSKLML